MLDPAGDGRDAGRAIGDSFESGITVQFAQALKAALHEAYPALHIVMSRYPGEVLEPFHQANFANRAQVDLFIRLQCYYERSMRPQCSCFYYSANPVTDEWPLRLDPYACIPVHEAHRFSYNKNKVIGQTLVESLQEFLPNYTVHALLGIPCAPLLGIRVPALCLEFGIKEADAWQQLIAPIVNSFEFIVRS